MKNLLRNVAYASIIVAATTVTVTHLNRPAEAQGGGSIIAYANAFGQEHYVLLSNGDLYHRRTSISQQFEAPSTYIGNYWDAEPISVAPSTWSQIKAKDWKPGN